MRVPMDNPAESSLAELTRLPVDKRSMAVAIARPDFMRESWATSDFTLVLTTDMVRPFTRVLKISG
jgi:hypothetical protein